MEKEIKILKTVKFPHFIDNSPCGEDLFAGKSHENISKSISDVIQNDESCSIIGIDGGWGSGKSNLVELVKSQLKENDYHFFIYDAWGHQEDLQRRSILEELTDDLINNDKNLLNSEKWELNLKRLLAKTREVEKKTIPKLSIGIIVTGLAFILTPILKIVTENVNSIYLKGSIISIPILCLLGLFICNLIKEAKIQKKTKRKRKIIKNASSRLFHIYQSGQKEDTTYETISEDEPTVRKFRNWMKEISDDLGTNKLILVFDNMDRLPKAKVQELWSSIHTFFAETKYDNIRVIVPFDREHIKSAFKTEDGPTSNTCFGDDFINKTFNVVYRVSPPILSDWKKYFKLKWQEAFGEEIDTDDNYNNVIQIYDLLNKDNTPRKIIAFINEFVSIHQISGNKIPDKYIALFIIGKNSISLKATEEILKPTYMDSLLFLYKNDEDLPKFISALYYQIDPDIAIQVVFTDKLKIALNNNEPELIQQISVIPEFYLILENAIVDVVNVENAILALNTIADETTNINKQSQHIWNCLYQKAGIENGQKLKEYQKILLAKTSYYKIYLSKILKGYINDNGFVSVDYYKSILELKEIVENVDVYSLLQDKYTSVIDFISFVNLAKGNYFDYKIYCNEKELDDHLSSINENQLIQLETIPYIKEHYTLSKYINRIENLITTEGNTLDKKTAETVLKRYKELKKPFTVKFDDAIIYTHFTNSMENEDFYFDLLAMRISKLSSFSPSYVSYFDAALNRKDNPFVIKVAERLECYMNYGDILTNLNLFNQYPLYKEVAKEITKKSYGASIANLIPVLQKFDNICLNGEIEPVSLIKRFSASNTKGIDSTNIKGLASVLFITNALNEQGKLSKHCILCVTSFLNSLTVDQWKVALINIDSYEFKMSQLIEDYKYPQNAIDALKIVLNEIASGVISIPNKIIWNSLISQLEKQGRKHTATFNTIRDSFCRDGNISVALFSFFGDWLFYYSDLEKKQETLRTIFTSAVLIDKLSLELILKNKDKMIPIINASGDNESSDFKDIIRNILEKNNDLSFVEFAKTIGVEKNEVLVEEKTQIG